VRLVAYVRVSEESENPDNQRYAIFEFCSRHGYKVVDVFLDVGVSGALAPRDRPGFRRVLEVLDGVDGVIVYALDRIARSLVELVEVVKEIEGRGKVVLSVRESWLQQLDPKVRSIIIAILGWAAEMEREFIRERTREALRRLKAMGRRLGRKPKINESIAREAIKYVEKGYTLKDAAKVLGVNYHTLARFLTRNTILRSMYYNARARAKPVRDELKP